MYKQKVEQLLLAHLQEPNKENEALVLACLKLYLNIIGDEVVKVISPVNELSAPFTAAVLEHYAKNIRNQYDCDNRFVEGLKAFIADKPIVPKAPKKESAKKGAGKANAADNGRNHQ